jgi:hypothetical protein
MNDANLSYELLPVLLEHHRFYINRNWQFFAALLVVDSVVLNAFDGLVRTPLLGAGVSLSSLALIGVFYHLINWTDLRIDLNVARINRIQSFELVPPPRHFLEGLIYWMKFGLFVLCLPHFLLAARTAWWLVPVGLFVLVVLVVVSEQVVRAARKRLHESEG